MVANFLLMQIIQFEMHKNQVRYILSKVAGQYVFRVYFLQFAQANQ